MNKLLNILFVLFLIIFALVEAVLFGFMVVIENLIFFGIAYAIVKPFRIPKLVKIIIILIPILLWFGLKWHTAQVQIETRRMVEEIWQLP